MVIRYHKTIPLFTRKGYSMTNSLNVLIILLEMKHIIPTVPTNRIEALISPFICFILLKISLICKLNFKFLGLAHPRFWHNVFEPILHRWNESQVLCYVLFTNPSSRNLFTIR